MTWQPATPTDVTATPLPADRILALADRYRYAVLAAAVALLLLGFSGQWRPEPDAALYLNIGRSLAEGQGYTYHGSPHPLAYPGLPWLLAGLFRLSPGHAVFLAHLVMLGVAVGCLALTYRLILLHAGRPTAVVVTFGLVITRMFFRYAFELRSDMPFLLGVLGVLVGFESLFYAPRRGRSRRAWLDLPLLIGGLALAVVMRPTMWALLAAIATTLAAGIVRGRLKAGGLLLLAVLGVAVMVTRLDPRSSQHGLGDYEQAVWTSVQAVDSLTHRVGRVNLPSLLSPAASEALFGIDFGLHSPIPGLSLNTIPGLMVLGLGFWLFSRRMLWGSLFAWTVLMILAVLALDRYLLPVLPLLVFGWWSLLAWLNRRLPRRWGSVAMVGLLVLGAATNLPRILTLIGEQRSGKVIERFRGGRYAFAPGLGSEIARLTPEAIDPLQGPWVVAPSRYGRILSFYSRRWVVEAVRPEHAGGAPWQRLHVVNPGDSDVRAFLEARGLVAGEAIAGQAPWTLHAVHVAP